MIPAYAEGLLRKPINSLQNRMESVSWHEYEASFTLIYLTIQYANNRTSYSFIVDDSMSESDCMASTCGIIDGQLIGNYVEGKVCGLIWSIIKAFLWRKCEKAWKFHNDQLPNQHMNKASFKQNFVCLIKSCMYRASCYHAQMNQRDSTLLMNDLYYLLIESTCLGLSPVHHQEHHLIKCITE